MNSIDRRQHPVPGPHLRRCLRAIPRRAGFLMLGLLAAVACDRPVTGPDQELDGAEAAAARAAAGAANAPPRRAAQGALVGWNETARERVALHATSPPLASRVYALLGLAQLDALTRLRVAPSPGRPGRAGSGSAESAAVSAASAAVLAHLYPDEAEELMARAGSDPAPSGPRGRPPEDLSSAIAIGEAAAAAVIEEAATDGSDAVWDGSIPTRSGIWFSSLDPPQPPLLPLWGSVRPWLMESGSQFRSPAPPVFGSPEFLSALAEVRRFSDTRTAEQQRIAEFWADGAGTYTPPGHWNEIAAELIVGYRLGALRAARVFAYMNMALMDAGIACWEAKFTYWLIRPSQVDPEIWLAVGLPNFPAYTSGHSAFSGAASEVLGHFFPAERRRLRALAEEAAISRIYGGIHYRFDSDRGLEQGRAVARLAIERARADAPLWR
ncbi:MAG: vanadium-dependent haloperoxidase [Longimicrobiales bacterium]